MAKDKNKTGRIPQNDATDRDRRSKSDPANHGPSKPGSGSMKQKIDRDRDSEVPSASDDDSGTPSGRAPRGSQHSSPDRNSQRIDDDDDIDDDMDSDPGSPLITPRNR